MRRRGASLAVVCGLPTFSTCVRVRPPQRGRRGGRRGPVPPLRIGQAGRFVLDAALGESASQAAAYASLAAPLVEAFLQGENCLLLAYGAAGTGKSHTLQGGSEASGGSSDAGVVLRAAHAALRGLSIVPRHKYALSLSFCGLGIGHDAHLHDLLAQGPQERGAVSLRDGSAAAALAGLTAWSVEDVGDVQEALKCKRPASAARGSSGKQHTMLTLQLDSYAGDGALLQRNTLSFVELAAPDPLGRSSSASEAANARSLAVAYSSLAKVLAALRNTAAGSPGSAAAAAAAAATAGSAGQAQLQHVPWRDSPLTRWLQDRLHAANAIALLATVSAEPEAASDTLATISWISRFTSASRSGAGGVVVSFAWEALADPEGGPFMRFQPDAQQQEQQQEQQEQEQEQQQEQGATAHGSCLGAPDPASAICSSPMAKLGSPNLVFTGESAGSPRSIIRPRSAASVCHAGGSRWPCTQPMQPQSPSSPLRGGSPPRIHPWQRQLLQPSALALAPLHMGEPPGEQPPAAAAAPAHESRQQDDDALSAAGALAPDAAAGAAPQPGVLQQQEQAEDEVLLFGELLTAVRRGGGGLRAEAILEQLLQELGAARAALSAERGEARAVCNSLAAVQAQHAGCGPASKLLQEQVQELQQQLGAARKSLAEVSADRDLFLRRLQQLELLEGDAGAASARQASSMLEQQRQKAHAAQLRMMEAELNALASSNQQLRSQLELSGQQAACATRDKLAAQEAAASLTQKAAALQQETEVLRSAADIEGAVRKQLEASIDELQRVCDASARELAAVTAARATLEQEHVRSQDSVDALAAELQDTLARCGAAEERAAALEQQLAGQQQEAAAAQQQASSLQAQVSALQATAQQLEQQQARTAEGTSQQQAEASALSQLLQDLQAVFTDFEADLAAAQPSWQQLLNAPASSGPPGSAAAGLRSRLRTLFQGSHASRLASPTSARPHSPTHGGRPRAAELALPAAWAAKLQGVVEVLSLAGQDSGRTAEELAAARQRMQLLDSNVAELRKLVATQEGLQQQLATQLDASTATAQAREQQLADAQAAVAAVAGELQECQATLKATEEAQQSQAAELAAARAAVRERSQALDALADELVAAMASSEQLTASKQAAEEQLLSLASELEEALLQLSVREQVLDQLWTELREPAAQAEAQPAASPGVPAVSSLPPSVAAPAAGEGSSGVPALGRSEQQLERLRQQLHQRQQRQPLAQQEARKLQAPAGAAGLAQQAIAAARRRSSQHDAAHRAEAAAPAVPAAGVSPAACPQDPGSSWSERGVHPALARHQHAQQVQPLVVAAVQRLRQQVASLSQQADAAEASRQEAEGLAQQLHDVQQQCSQQLQQLEQLEQLQAQQQLLETEAHKLSRALAAKEKELDEAQEACLQLSMDLKQQQQQPAALDALAQAQARLGDAELQLADCRRQLADAKSAAAEAAAALAAERAARLAAEDRDASRQGLLARLGSLQDEVETLHGALVEEKKSVVALRDELGLMSTSRDTWKDAARRAEAAVADAKAAAEQRSTELTRARAEVLQLRQEHAAASAQLQLLVCSGGGALASASEGMAARLAAAQVLRREAEERAAGLARQLAESRVQLAELQQQAGDSAAELTSQVCATQAQLARAKADLAATRAAGAAQANAGGGTGSDQQQQQHAEQQQQQQQQQQHVEQHQLLAARAEVDVLRQQLKQLQSLGHTRADVTAAADAAGPPAAVSPELEAQLEAAAVLVHNVRQTAAHAAAVGEPGSSSKPSALASMSPGSPPLISLESPAGGWALGELGSGELATPTHASLVRPGARDGPGSEPGAWPLSPQRARLSEILFGARRKGAEAPCLY